MSRSYTSGIIKFGRDKFSLVTNTAHDGIIFEIDWCWKLEGYIWPVRYSSKYAMEVKDWCAEFAPNAHLCNNIAHAVLFKDEGTSIAFKLTFTE